MALFIVYWCVWSALIGSVLGGDRPVIGVLAQEKYDSNSTYVSASYVKAIEASGARVVPVLVDRDVEYYRDLSTKLNGYVFPGGAADITSDRGYARSGKIIFRLVSDLNARGVSVPILGVCLGMELLGLLTTGVDLRKPCPVRNEALSLRFLPGYRNSSLFRAASQYDLETLSRFNSTSNHHRQCLNVETLDTNRVDNWRILSLSTGSRGDTFISAMEMKSMPVAAVMFHPEKNAYEWKPGQANPHDLRSVAAARLFYDWLVRHSRANDLIYDDDSESTDDLIYNYCPTFTGKNNGYDVQDYIFS